jgi:hypothetical protein
MWYTQYLLLYESNWYGAITATNTGTSKMGAIKARRAEGAQRCMRLGAAKRAAPTSVQRAEELGAGNEYEYIFIREYIHEYFKLQCSRIHEYYSHIYYDGSVNS